MARTVADEVYGGVIEATGLSATYRLRLPFLANGARLYDLSSTGAINVVLPGADMLPMGSGVYAIANKGSFTLTMKCADTTTTVCTIAAGQLVVLHLVDDSTSNGTWQFETSTTVNRGGSLVAGRVPMTLSLPNNSATGVVLRDLADAEGYTGDYPLALRVEIGTGTDPVIRGSEINSTAVSTGMFYPGTSILVMQRAVLTGHGGRGGIGGTSGSGAGGAGTIGGTAFLARHNVRIINFGTIQGGGGGGGGGAGATSAAGGGGGGGSGQAPGLGGAGGNTSAAAGLNGAAQSGGSGGAGQTGASSGGAGGAPGTAGTAGSGSNGGAGGAAGYSLRAIGATITLVNLGTITGPQVLS